MHENIDELIEACRSRIRDIEKALWEDGRPLSSPTHEPQANKVRVGCQKLRALHHVEQHTAQCASLIDALRLTQEGEGVNASLLESYHAAFQEMERLIALKGDDDRHQFVIVIPVADRPQHLKSCLDSLLHLCRSFGYGGFADHRYRKVSVIIADDSRDADNMVRNQAIANDCEAQGIATRYFGLSEQLDQMNALTGAEKKALSGILGDTDRETFFRKGPSIMRNIAYLKLNEMRCDAEKILFYFIDSDQEFQIKVSTAAGDGNLYATNYFYCLDRIFSSTDATILTGKVVGDPPVSPSVMAGNFLEDVIGFLHQIAGYDPSQPCQFHDTRQHDDDEASYHDMAGLFGFKPAKSSYQYRCSITGEHDNSRCFSHFSSKLNRFFYGEHPTRKTYYRHEDLMTGVRPARTIYTGNYIFKPEGLKYFIPFATLKLRMAGPVLGRLIKSEIGDSFVSANLPMLHKRTVGTTGQSEFRPGIAADTATIDLSGEFERQFYGDVMLFTIEKLTGIGYPVLNLSNETIVEALESTHATLLQRYNQKRRVIREKLDLLKTLIHDRKNGWELPTHAEAAHNFQVFMDNIEHNFGDHSPCYDLINSRSNQAKRHAEIVVAIARYGEDGRAWGEMLARSA